MWNRSSSREAVAAGFLEFEEEIRAACGAEFSLPGDSLRKLYDHYRLLLKWNRVVQLTTVTDISEAVRRHYCESLFVARRLPPAPLTVLDLGSGAGFPGVPIAACRPDCKLVLAERRRRKAAFLKEATRGWGNVDVFGGPVDELRGKFDWVVARAVRPQVVLKVAEGKADSVALLVGRSTAEEVGSRPEVAWQPPIILPWGERRVLLMGRVVHMDA